MNNEVKDIDIKNRTYYFFNDFINRKNFNSNNIKTDENSYKNILIYYIGLKSTEKKFTTPFNPVFSYF